MTVELRALGSVEIRMNGSSLRFTGVKSKQLLVALLLHPNEVVPTERLIDGLWPSNPPKSAIENLRTYVTILRNCWNLASNAERPRLSTSRAGMRLEVNVEMIDVSRFLSMVDLARDEITHGGVRRGARFLNEALALWRGKAGEGVPRDGWLASALEALDGQRLIAFEQRAEAYLAIGHHVELVPELVRALAEHPLRERLWQHLMLAHYRCGNAGEALNAYARARRTLARELGIDPGEQLQSLQHAILRRDTSLNNHDREGKVHPPSADQVAPFPTHHRSASHARFLAISSNSRRLAWRSGFGN